MRQIQHSYCFDHVFLKKPFSTGFNNQRANSESKCCLAIEDKLSEGKEANNFKERKRIEKGKVTMDGGYCKWQHIEVIVTIIHMRQSY